MNNKFYFLVRPGKAGWSTSPFMTADQMKNAVIDGNPEFRMHYMDELAVESLTTGEFLTLYKRWAGETLEYAWEIYEGVRAG